MKKIVLAVCFLCMICVGTAIAGDQDNNPTGTIAGSELLQDRYQYVDPATKVEASDATKKLIDQGSITAVKDAQASGQAGTSQGN